MEKFTQKWALISLLEPVEEGSMFFWKDFPLHITLAGTFAINSDSSGLYNELTSLLVNNRPVNSKAEGEAYWGQNKEYHVVLMQKTPEIMALHNKIIQGLKRLNAVFDEPDYVGDGYLPHSTMQKSARLNLGEAIKIDGITIVDLFPNNDSLHRKILGTVRLTEE